MDWGFEIVFPIRSQRRRNVILRLFGIGLLVMGLLHVVAGFATVINARSQPVVGQSPFFGFIFVGSGALSLAIGWWLCRRRASRPDLGDVHPLLRKSAGFSDGYIGPSGKRTWWTGDPIPTKEPATPNEELKPTATPSSLVE